MSRCSRKRGGEAHIKVELSPCTGSPGPSGPRMRCDAGTSRSEWTCHVFAHPGPMLRTLAAGARLRQGPKSLGHLGPSQPSPGQGMGVLTKELQVYSLEGKQSRRGAPPHLNARTVHTGGVRAGPAQGAGSPGGGRLGIG